MALVEERDNLVTLLPPRDARSHVYYLPGSVGGSYDGEVEREWVLALVIGRVSTLLTGCCGLSRMEMGTHLGNGKITVVQGGGMQLD
jgi:hypothetical protein